ncbi:leucine-rich repeat protein, partial [Porcipelethomonas sp.]|uniref:leucine-rich repeat protein n=1 Tax=Porcipelethomonas sp. TaxID=2981675 RepID=UPI003EF89FBA
MKKKRFISFVTSAVMAAMCLGGGLSELTSRIHLVNEPLIAEAETTGTYGDLSYTAYTNYVEITDCDESTVSVEIPDEIDGLPVTSIEDDAFSLCTSLESIMIPDGVTSIKRCAF